MDLFLYYIFRVDDTQPYIDEAWSSPDLTQKSHYIIFDFDDSRYGTEIDGIRISAGDGGYVKSFSVNYSYTFQAILTTKPPPSH